MQIMLSKTEFNEYVKSIKNDIGIAKRKYYFHVFNIHRNNIQQTWNTISETLTLSGPGYLMSLKVRGGHMCPPSNLVKY